MKMVFRQKWRVRFVIQQSLAYDTGPEITYLAHACANEWGGKKEAFPISSNIFS